MKIMLKNDMGALKEVKVGFSWTTLFFGALTPLFRGDFKWFIIQAILAVFTWGFSHIVFAFIYNKIYIKDLINQGYSATTEDGENILRTKGFIA